ncbi:copper chaperone PCu(A)C [Devosia sp. 63-57]|uniref:copper chaperone PCu(A)C n=1 Tax=Devosia sp. 63-57 TaxID=1895751 RepID=UPI00086CF0F9|nr:copper chaperone PCu(A)C [Devosia sp. 63-57]ODT51028.1 MAG: hypothetical protein ABS74_02635 [Pelagibacterium sp. SCN 63-126]ODU84560.1 MAG: hypothetical protein ABT14_14290 [Pelagibacterium sp. SCN 63-17]OJX44313.1 MAG: hypothetical protein BGO80_01690 [Devosia sp. 63-57]
MQFFRVGVLALMMCTAPTAFAQQSGSIQIVTPFSRATLPNAGTGGAYFSIANLGTQDDILLSAETPVAEEVQLHSMAMDGDVMRMRQMPDGIPVPAGSTVVLEPSGLHLMLVRLKQPLKEGDTLPLTLNFEKAGTIDLEVPIGSIAARKAP